MSTRQVAAPLATKPAAGEEARFQNLDLARTRVQELFGFELMTSASGQDWKFARRCFQKRHLLAHKMGVVDDACIRAGFLHLIVLPPGRLRKKP